MKQIPCSAKKYHGLCDSNKLLYKRCAKSMGKPKFRPPQLPHFQPILMKLEAKKDIQDTTPHAKFNRCGRRKEGLRREGFSVTFCVLFFFVFLLTPTGHTRRPITTVYGSKRVVPRKVGFFGGLNNKK